MNNQVAKAIIVLDMVLLIMTAAWILFGVARGIGRIELMYNYVYIITLTITLLLNMKQMYQR